MLALRGFAILSLAQMQLLLKNRICFDVYRYKIMIGFWGGKRGRRESVTTIKGLKTVLKEKVMFRTLVQRVPLEAALKTRGIRNGRMLSERNLKVSEAGCPYVPKDKPGRRKGSLHEQGASARTQRRKESL